MLFSFNFYFLPLVSTNSRIVIVYKTDFLFCTSHNYIVMDVNSTIESFFCNDKLRADFDLYLIQWSKHHFSGRETFNEVKSCLSGYINSFGEDSMLSVFTMSKLIKYNKEVLVYNDLEVTLCGCTSESILVM